MTIPNVLSVLRIGLAPVLLTLAWRGASDGFVGCLALALATDIADGLLARRLGQTSELGARLDSWGDLLPFLCVPVPPVLPRPAFLRREMDWFAIAVGTAVMPAASALAPF